MMELLFKWFYNPFFLVSNQSSDDNDLLTCLVFFFWRNSFCAMSQNLTKFLLFNFRIRWIMELIFQMIQSFFLFSIKLEFRRRCPPLMSAFFDEFLFAQWAKSKTIDFLTLSVIPRLWTGHCEAKSLFKL